MYLQYEGTFLILHSAQLYYFIDLPVYPIKTYEYAYETFLSRIDKDNKVF